MFRSIVISPDQRLGGEMVLALEATGFVSVVKNLDEYPEPADLLHMLRVHAADVLFLNFEPLDRALAVVQFLEVHASHVPVVGFHSEADPYVLRESMRAGVREFVVPPFARENVMESLSHIKTLLDRRPAASMSTEQIFTFLPSKAGVGTSTIAANVAAALARKPDTHVLLADFDLNSGMLRFMMNLKNEHAVSDAINFASELDEGMWPQLVTAVHGMDVLHAGRLNPNLRIDPAQIRNLMTFLRRRYQALCFDLSGNLEKYSIELMQESKYVFLVCTPEVPSLHLAREKAQFLRQFDLGARISVLLNRVGKKPLFTAKQVEELLELPVLHEFPNDYEAIHQSVTEATLLPKVSRLGKAFTDFVESLTNGSVPNKPQPSGRRFLEFVTMAASPVPARD